MSKQASPARIGAFVLGAIALVVAGVLAFGSGRLFQDSSTFVTFFQGSVRGLRAGALVTFRGVPVGQVTEIQAMFDSKTLELDIPVIFEFREDAVQVLGGEGQAESHETSVKRLIDHGLRAQLSIDSLVTGQLIVDLDFHPHTDANYRGWVKRYPEIPSIPTSLQQLSRRFETLLSKVQQLPLEELIESALSATDGAAKLINSPELARTVSGFDKLVNSDDTQALPGSARRAVEEAQGALSEARELVSSVDAQVEPLAKSVLHAIDVMDEMLVEARQVLTTARAGIRKDSELYYRMNGTLAEVENTMRSLRIFVDYLERHPEALIRGKRSEQ